MDFNGWSSRRVWEVALYIDNDRKALDAAVEARAGHPIQQAFIADLENIYPRYIHRSLPRLNQIEKQELFDHYFSKLADIRGEIVTCPGCGTKFNSYYQYAYHSGGYYCSDKCYSKLFEKCEGCGNLSMTVITNRKRGMGNLPPEPLCDTCYHKKYKISVVTIGSSQYRTR